MLCQLPPVTKGHRSVQGIAQGITPLLESFLSADSASDPLEGIWVIEKALCSQRVILHFGKCKADIAMLRFKFGEEIWIFLIFVFQTQRTSLGFGGRCAKANEVGI